MYQLLCDRCHEVLESGESITKLTKSADSLYEVCITDAVRNKPHQVYKLCERCARIVEDSITKPL